MQFRRNLLRNLALRSLAPLLGLSALMAAMSATGASLGPQADGRSLARLLRSVVDIVSPAVEQASAHHSYNRPSPQAVLGISALAATPLAHSVWMVAHSASVPRLIRAARIQPLRC